MNARDELTMRVLGLRQLVRDVPEVALPATEVLLGKLEEELVKLAKESGQ